MSAARPRADERDVIEPRRSPEIVGPGDLTFGIGHSFDRQHCP